MTKNGRDAMYYLVRTIVRAVFWTTAALAVLIFVSLG